MTSNSRSEEFPPIGAPAIRALDQKGIKNHHDLSAFSEKELLSLHGFGPKALRLLKATLKEKGLSVVLE